MSISPPDDLLDGYYLGDDPDMAARVIADWYEEHGDPEQAAFIHGRARLLALDPQEEAADVERDACDRAIVRNRDAWGLSDARDSPWLFSILDLAAWRFSRSGMLEWAEWGEPTLTESGLDSAFAQSPARKLRFAEPLSLDGLMPTLQSPAGKRIRGLSVAVPRRTVENLETWLPDTGLLDRLNELVLRQMPVPRQLASLTALRRLRCVWTLGPLDWLPALIGSHVERNLRELTLQLPQSAGVREMITPAVWQAVLGDTSFPNLQRISMHGGGSQLILSPDLFTSPSSSLREVNLDNITLSDGITDRHAERLGSHLGRMNLRSLSLGEIHGLDANTLPGFFHALGVIPSLRSLALDDPLPSSTLAWLAQWPGLATLSDCEIAVADLEANEHDLSTWTSSPHIQGLRSLTLTVPLRGFTDFGWLRHGFMSGSLRSLRLLARPRSPSAPPDAWWTALAESTIARTLRRLELHALRLTAVSMRQFAEMIPMPELRQLRLVQSGTTAKDCQRLMRSPNLPKLWLFECPSAEGATQTNHKTPPGWERIGPGIYIHPERMT